jgi:hypothetical protein
VHGSQLNPAQSFGILILQDASVDIFEKLSYKFRYSTSFKARFNWLVELIDLGLISLFKTHQCPALYPFYFSYVSIQFIFVIAMRFSF